MSSCSQGAGGRAGTPPSLDGPMQARLTASAVDVGSITRRGAARRASLVLALLPLGCLPACFGAIFTQDFPPDPYWINCGYPAGFAYTASLQMTTDCFPGGDANLIVRGEMPADGKTAVAQVEVQGDHARTLPATLKRAWPQCLLTFRDETSGLTCAQDTFPRADYLPTECTHADGTPATCSMTILPPPDLTRDTTGTRRPQ